MGDDAAAITKFTLALRRWYRQVLGWHRASPIAAIHWEVDISNSLRLVLGRAFPLFGRLCATDPAGSRSPLSTHTVRLCAGHLGPPVRPHPLFAASGRRSVVLPGNWCSLGSRFPPQTAADLHGVLVDVATDLARWARPLCDRSVCSKSIGSPSDPCNSLKVLYIFKADTCSSHLLFASSGLFNPPKHNTESE